MLPARIINIVVMDNEDRREAFRREHLERRIMSADNDPFTLSDVKFKELFRLTKDMVQYLVNELAPHLTRQSALAINPQDRIFAVLYFYATGSYQRTIEQSWNISMSQPTISKCVHEISEVIVSELAEHWIKFPSLPVEINSVKTKFMEKTRFPGVIGAIDCTHIAIIAPTEQEHNYLNRKGYHSKNVQIICNSDLTITNINSRYGGAAHDAFIWRNSIILQELQRRYDEGDKHSWLLGDSGYPQQPWLMTPILHGQEGSPEFRCNRGQMSARNCIERCNGVLKSRFRCLLLERKLRYKPANVNNIVASCAILHNICVGGRLENDFPPAHENNIPVAANIDAQENQCGFEARRRIINRYFNV